MSRTFDGSGDFLRTTTTPVTATPLTFACWFYDTTAGGNDVLLCIADSAGNNDFFEVRKNPTENLSAGTGDSSGGVQAVSSTAYSLNAWHHAVAVFASPTSRTIYLDGGNSGINSQSRTPASLDRIAIAVRGNLGASFPFSGRLVWPAMWDVAFSAAEAARLFDEILCPMRMRRGNLRFFPPLVLASNRDLISGTDLVVVGSPTLSANPAGINSAACGGWLRHRDRPLRRNVLGYAGP